MQTPLIKGKFKVVVDTNALFCQDEPSIASQDFQKTWQSCCELAQLTLVVPEVVRGERLYQLLSAAKQSVDNAKKNFDTISKVSGFDLQSLPTNDELRAGAEKCFDDWLTQINGVIAPTPVDSIDWKCVVHDAIWRIKPFEGAVNSKKTEKGFRDRLVLETLRAVVQTTRTESDIGIVFICNDTALLEGANAQISTSFGHYKSLVEFLSFLKLLHQDLEQSLIQPLLERAQKVFFSPNDSECVFEKCNVLERITKSHSTLLAHLYDPSAPLINPSAFRGDSDEVVEIGPTLFLFCTGENLYHWNTNVVLSRRFLMGPEPKTLYEAFMNTTTRHATFDVFWTARVNDAAFSEFDILNIKFCGLTRDPAFREKYGEVPKFPCFGEIQE